MLINKQSKSGSKLSVGLNNEEFSRFLKIFCNMFIFKGKKSFAIKYINEIFFQLKQYKKNNKSLIILRSAADNLLPIIGCGKKRLGKGHLPFPFFLTGNKRFVLIFKWLIRDLRHKSNIFGVKKEQLVTNLIGASKKKGQAMESKKFFYKRALSGRYLLSSLTRKKKVFIRKRKR